MRFYIECVFLGLIAALGAFFLEFAVPETVRLFFLNNNPAIDNDSISPLMIGIFALLEEIMKFVIIKKRLTILSSGRRLIIGSLVVGIGFALTEIFFIYSSFYPTLSSDYVQIAGIFSFHILSAGAIGGLLSGPNTKTDKMLAGLATVSLLHFLYNISTLLPGFWTGVAAALIIALLAFANAYAFVRTPKTLA